jgi:hypothetical protein
MKPVDLQKFHQAIALYQQGHKAEAHTALLALSKEYSTESSVWLWLTYTADDLVLARSYLYRVQLLNPASPSLPGAEKWLAGEEAKKLLAGRAAKKPARQTLKTANQAQPETSSPPAVEIPPLAVETAQAAVKPPTPKPEIKPANPTPASEIKAAASTPEIKAAAIAQEPAAPIKTAKGAKAKARPKHRGRLILSLVCLIIFLGLGGAISAAILLNGQSADSLWAAGFPVYSNAARLELTPQDRETIIKSYADTSQPEKVKNLEFEFYKLKKSDKNNALNFYDRELTRLGWLAPPRNSVNANSFNLNSYQKDKQSFFIFTSEVPPDAYPLPSIRSQIHQDELLLIVFRTEEI